MPREMFIGHVATKVTVTTIGQLIDVRDVLHDRSRSAIARFECSNMEARRIRRTLATIDATVQLVAEIDTQVRHSARPRPSIERPPQPHLRRLCAGNGQAEESDDPSCKPELGNSEYLALLAALLPALEAARCPHRDGPICREHYPL